MNATRVYCSVIVILLAALPALGRKWTDVTGRYTIEGELVEVLSDRVRLKKQNGRFTTVPLSRLSEADRAFVRQVQTEQQQLRQRQLDRWLARWSPPYDDDTSQDSFERGYRGRDVEALLERDSLLEEVRNLQHAEDIRATIHPLEKLYSLTQSADIAEPYRREALSRVVQALVSAFAAQADWESAVRWQKELHQKTLADLGETDWRTIDQTTSLAYVERILASSPSQREQLIRANLLLTQASRQSDHQQGLDLIRSAAQSCAASFGEKHPYYADCLAREYQWETPTEEQLRHLVDVTQQALGQVHPTTIMRTIWLGNHLFRNEQWAAAQEVFSQAVTALRDLPDKMDFYQLPYEVMSLPTVLYDLAESFRTLQDNASAARQLRQQIVIYYQKVKGQSSWQARQAEFELSRFDIVLALPAEKLQGLEQLHQLRQEAQNHAYAAEYPRSLQSIQAYRTLQRQLANDPVIRQLIVEDPRVSARVAEEAADYAFRVGKMATAITYLQEAQTIWRQGFGKGCPGDHRATLQSIRLYQSVRDRAMQNDDLARAIATQKMIVDLAQSLYDDQHWRVMDAELQFRDLTGMVQLTAQERSELKSVKPLIVSNDVPLRTAIRNGEEALQFYGTLFGKDHLWRATVLTVLADDYDQLGHDDRAESYYQQAIDIRRRKLGEFHPDYVAALEGLARVYENIDRSDLASQLNRRASVLTRLIPDFVKERREQYVLVPMTSGDVHQFQDARAKTLAELADSYYQAGDFVRAEQVARRVVKFSEQSFGKNSLAYAASLSQLATVYLETGDYQRSESMHRECLQIRQALLGEAHQDCAHSLHNLGILYEKMDREDLARNAFEEAAAALRESPGAESTEYAHGISSLALLLAKMGQSEAAYDKFREANRILTLNGQQKSRAFLANLSNAGYLLIQLGKFASAEQMLQTAGRARREVLGVNHPDFADSLHDFALLRDAQQRYDEANKLMQQALKVVRRNVDVATAFQSERQQMLMSTAMRKYLDSYLSLASRAKFPADEVYQHVLAWKGAVLARRVRLLRHWQDRDPDFAETLHQLDQVAAELAGLAMIDPGDHDFEQWTSRLESLSREKEVLEVTLARRAEAGRIEGLPSPIKPEAVRDALPDNVALVDFLEYQHSQAGPSETPPQTRLVAFVLHAEYPTVRIELGDAATIGETVRQWRTRLTGSNPAAQTLRQTIWEPLEESLHGAELVLIAPDGPLASLPLAALPGKEPGSYLIEERAFANVLVPQQLPEWSTPPSHDSAATGDAGVSLLLLGDVAFDRLAPGDVSGPHDAPAGNASRRLVGYFDPLPGTKGEMLVIRDTFEQIFPDGIVRMLRAGRASESNFRAWAPRHQVLHLATHGFFAKDMDSAAEGQPSGAESNGRDTRFLTRQDIPGYHPDILCGVALAGVNSRGVPTADDGLLTAMEAAQLDLRDVQLAVLSACETGLGKFARGEGMLGLQRAFHVAGARAVIASSWKVDDVATRDLMERFYDNLWNKQMGKLESLREAQLWMLRERGPRQVRPIDDRPLGNRLPAYYWGAFVLSGDWR